VGTGSPVGGGGFGTNTSPRSSINVGARLQAHASPEEVVLAAALYPLIEAEYPEGCPDRLAMRGRVSPLTLWS
jgi:class 3 adenylate cyclase